jgi:hypothetical protein
MTSMIPCLKPFVAGLHTGYGAFDMEQVATQVQNSYGSNHHARKSRRTDHSSSFPSKSAFNSTTGPSSLVGDGVGKKRATLNGGLESPTTGHHGRPSQAIPVTRDMGLGLDPRVAGKDNGRGEGEVMNHTSAVAQDGNSIGSNDSQQMIIRKDVEWAVVYSDP